MNLPPGMPIQSMPAGWLKQITILKEKVAVLEKKVAELEKRPVIELPPSGNRWIPAADKPIRDLPDGTVISPPKNLYERTGITAGDMVITQPRRGPGRPRKHPQA